MINLHIKLKKLNERWKHLPISKVRLAVITSYRGRGKKSRLGKIHKV